MRTFLTIIMLAAIAVPAFAGGNPDVIGYIDFDPPDRVHTYMPVPYETFNAFICFGDLTDGLTSASFMINNVLDDCPGVFSPPSFTNILPGDLAIGNYLTGITVAATECMPGPDVCVGYVTLFYLGGECCLKLMEHPDFPRWVLDCDEVEPQIDEYTLIANGDIGAPDICEPISPVEDATWGTIKAMYK